MPGFPRVDAIFKPFRTARGSHFWSRIFPVFLISGLVVGGGFSALLAQENGKAERAVSFESIEGPFFEVQDANGYFWQAAENGALTSGQTRYLQSGLNLLVNGEGFAPDGGEMAPPAEATPSGRIELVLRERRADYVIERDLWFDRERGAVRVVDSIRNESGRTLTLEVDLRTTFPFDWRSLHGDDGRPLSSDPALALGEGNAAILVHFSAAEGRKDTFLLCGTEEGGLSPRLSAAKNRRELTLHYELVVPPGGSSALFHWIGRTGLPSVEAFGRSLAPFRRNGELIEPGVEPVTVPAIANAPPSAFPRSRGAAPRLRSLVALNRILERFGGQRRGADALWLDSATQLAGKITGDDVVTVEDDYLGTTEVETSDIAAIRGRGRGGRSPRVFLRDGRVLVGEVTDFDLVFEAENGGLPRELGISDFSLLLFALDSEDGLAPESVSGFLELVDGRVLALPRKARLQFDGMTPWGAESFPFEGLVKIERSEQPFPSFRLFLEDGSRFHVFPTETVFRLPTEEGEPVEIPVASLDRYWRSGFEERDSDSEQRPWLSFEEVPADFRIDAGFLFAGGAMRTGRLAGDSLRWQPRDAPVAEIPVTAVLSLERNPEGSESGAFTLRLSGGEKLHGSPVSPRLRVSFGESNHLLPLEIVHAYRAPQT